MDRHVWSCRILPGPIMGAMPLTMIARTGPTPYNTCTAASESLRTQSLVGGKVGAFTLVRVVQFQAAGSYGLKHRVNSRKESTSPDLSSAYRTSMRVPSASSGTTNGTWPFTTPPTSSSLSGSIRI